MLRRKIIPNIDSVISRRVFLKIGPLQLFSSNGMLLVL